MHIREIQLKDFLGVVSLVKNELGCNDVSSDIYDRVMRIYHEPNYVTFVAKQSDGIVGFASIMRGLAFEMEGEYVRVIAMAVRRDYIDSDIGAQLIGKVEDYALEIGAGSIALTSGLRRTDVHAFYEKMGYRKMGCSFLKLLPVDKEPTYNDIFAPIPHREDFLE